MCSTGIVEKKRESRKGRMDNVGYVLGNGPSRDRNRKKYDGVTYGCNSIYKEMNVDVLVSMDTWY